MSWSIGTGGQVLLDGSPQPITAIFAALADNDGARIRGDLPGVTFSRRALMPAIVFEGTFPTDLAVHVGVRIGQQWESLRSDQDSVVINGTWYALHAPTVDALRRLTQRLAIPVGPIDAGQYLRLSGSPEVLGYIEDRTEHLDGALWVARSSQLPPPGRLAATLFPYQVAGSSFARTLARLGVGCLIADEMGLGKTIQAISLIADQPIGTKTLVVCPASLLENWRRELASFAPHLRVLIHRGPMRTGVPNGFADYDVVVGPYDTIVLDRGLMANCEWDFVVLDEAQNIRNPDTNRSVAMKDLRRRISVALTGTPVENTLQDLYSIAEFVMPSLLGSREDFLRMFPDLQSAAVRLGELVAPVSIRRLVADVASDLPSLVERDVALELDPADQAAYSAIEVDSPGLAGITLLRVLCAHASQDEEISSAALRERPKVSLLLSELEEVFARGHKAVVFASFRETLQRLAYLTSLQEPSAYIAILDGGVAVDERQQIIDEFSAHDGPGCLFLNPAAAGVGLNIVAANHVFHFNPEYNPAKTRQATARCFRRGQTLPVFVQHYFYADTVEEAAVAVAEAKIDLAEGVDEGMMDGVTEGQGGRTTSHD